MRRIFCLFLLVLCLPLTANTQTHSYNSTKWKLIIDVRTPEEFSSSHIEGAINLPGSKSLSNRALLLAALAKGNTRVTNLLDSDDVRHMLNALKQLGVSYSLSADKTECDVTGLGGAFAWHSGLSLFLGNAGTAMRPLAAALCLRAEQAESSEIVLTGEPRMKERPIKHLVDALRQAGAEIDYLENDGYPPIAIRNSGLKGGKVRIDG